MRAQLRIVSGTLRGRKLTFTVHASLRPTPEMVRQALFNILGNAVPGRPFLDVFAGTGVVGLEALSRGASHVTFVERDFRIIATIEQHLQQFGVVQRATLVRSDVYRWSERWQAPDEPVNVFLSPPFIDFERCLDDLLAVVQRLQQKLAPGSVLILQAEHSAILDPLHVSGDWEQRRYGRNVLAIWVASSVEGDPSAPKTETDGI